MGCLEVVARLPSLKTIGENQHSLNCNSFKLWYVSTERQICKNQSFMISLFFLNTYLKLSILI